ncbi:kinase-like domain-containing protein [Radiomyces spectabilis]|uniref:kinase-like domain-containing protein n=1 Tax=Radiomyces spectabilis TaxID=64574 RepID=UPI00221FCCD4|nr:kinase-like domain-containing protein [Radiomyces spectabilis]KAI8379126.1 kinase-like domain-containing protein [Radiomyces spectabilis]
MGFTLTHRFVINSFSAAPLLMLLFLFPDIFPFSTFSLCPFLLLCFVHSFHIVHVMVNSSKSKRREVNDSTLAQRLRKFSLSRRSSATPIAPTSQVVTTNTIYKDYDPATGNKIINDYMIIREIGRGVHGKVKLAQDINTGELVAIKIVDKRTRKKQHGLIRGQVDNPLLQNRENEQKVRREIAILKKCSHPHVVKLLQVIDNPASRKIYMALEYMEGGEIQWRDEDERPVLSLDQARSIFRDVVSGLDYLHYQGIIHRDIKPANLLLTRDQMVKISDFGVSYFNELLAGDDTEIGTQKQQTIDRELAETAGTPAFFAPELCAIPEDEGDRHWGHISKAIDVWALGITLYCFIFGRCPFTATTEFELFEIIPTAPLTFPDPADTGIPISDDLKDLLHRLLHKYPQERITLDEVKVHPWVIADLPDPTVWWDEADPRRYKAVEVTEEEVTHAVTIMGRLLKSIHRLSHSLSSLTHSFGRHRSKSTSLPSPSSSSSPCPLYSTVSAPPPPTHDDNSLITPLNYAKTSASTSVLPYPIDHRPSSCSYLSDSSSYNSSDLAEADILPSHRISDYDRYSSSASSSSGLVVSFNRPRLTPTPSSISHSISNN